MCLRKKSKIILNLILISVFLQAPIVSIAQDFEPNTLIVKLKTENSELFNKAKTKRINGVQIQSIKAITKGKIKTKNHIENIYKLRISDELPLQESCQKLISSSKFEYCQPNYYDHILYTPSDPRAANQYALSIVHAFEAWDICKGDSNIVIGVSDTGIDFNHDDLRNNIAYNLNDPIDGVDNDYDGYIDNYMGWDFGSGDNNPQWNESGTSGNAIHGTFTSGLAGARTDNGVGIASMGFSNKILPIKISNDYGSISTGYESIIYAAEHGCKIINCSWGSTTSHSFGRDVIEYVTEELNVIVVAAAGNDNNENLFYPASYDNVVSVAASNNVDEKWSSSSYNWRVDISAPGQDVLSTLSNSTYGTSSGTSFSSPIIASALSLIMAYYPDTLSNKQLIEVLKTTSDYIDTVGQNMNYHNKLGNGRLNLYKALQGNFGPSLSYIDFDVQKNLSQAYAGDTAEFIGYITNYLTSSSNTTTITISSSSEYVEILDSIISIPSIQENDSISVNNYHLKLVIGDDTPNNELIEFNIHIENSSYQKDELRSIRLFYPSIELNKNRIHTTLFPEERIAYSYDYRGFGLEIDRQDNILYEMGVVAGYSNENTIANIRSYSDFSPQSYLDSVSSNNRWFAQNKVFTNTITSLNIDTKYETFDDSLYQNFFFIHYKISNTSNSEYNNLYFGMFADWDISDYSANYTSIDTNLRLALTHCYTNKQIAGMQLLSHTKWNRYAMDNIANGDDIYSRDGLSREELFYALSNNNYYEGIDGNGTDILDLISAGPFELNMIDTLELTFAVIADTNEQNIIYSGQVAQQLYDSLYYKDEGIVKPLKNKSILIYPNPAHNKLQVSFDKALLYSENEYIKIYNLIGELVLTTKLKKSVDISQLKKGIYLVKIGNYSKKILIE